MHIFRLIFPNCASSRPPCLPRTVRYRLLCFTEGESPPYAKWEVKSVHSTDTNACICHSSSELCLHRLYRLLCADAWCAALWPARRHMQTCCSSFLKCFLQRATPEQPFHSVRTCCSCSILSTAFFAEMVRSITGPIVTQMRSLVARNEFVPTVLTLRAFE
jgi:hypothetical protein